MRLEKEKEELHVTLNRVSIEINDLKWNLDQKGKQLDESVDMVRVEKGKRK